MIPVLRFGSALKFSVLMFLSLFWVTSAAQAQSSATAQKIAQKQATLESLESVYNSKESIYRRERAKYDTSCRTNGTRSSFCNGLKSSLENKGRDLEDLFRHLIVTREDIINLESEQSALVGKMIASNRAPSTRGSYMLKQVQTLREIKNQYGVYIVQNHTSTDYLTQLRVKRYASLFLRYEAQIADYERQIALRLGRTNSF